MDMTKKPFKLIMLISAAVIFCCSLAWGAGPTEEQKNTLRQIIKDHKAMEEAKTYGRPVYHFTPRKNWMNDPNGLVYAGGIWHMFFQYDPASKYGSQKAWGQIQFADIGKTMKLRILTDTDPMEIFGNDGGIYMPFISKARGSKLSLDVHLPVKLIRARVSVIGR